MLNKETIIDSLSITPISSLLFDSSAHVKNISDDQAIYIFNKLSKTNPKKKGREMMKIKKKTQDLNNKIQILENRVKHIQDEQLKAQKNIFQVKKKYQQCQEIRKGINNDKEINEQYKEKQIKELEKKRETKCFFKKNHQEMLLTQKQNLLKTNKNIKNQIKQEIINSEKLFSQKQIENLAELKKKAASISRLNKSMIEKRNQKIQSLRAIKEQEYDKRIKEEILYQEKAAERVIELEKLEEMLIEKYQVTDIFNTDRSLELLFEAFSPMNEKY